MRILKKVTSIFIAAALLSISVCAAEYTAQADGLNKLGLFKGTENGYELDKNFTRAEGAAMLVRLLGKEKEVLSAQPIGLFADVPANDWAAPYIFAPGAGCIGILFLFLGLIFLHQRFNPLVGI